MTNEHEPLCVTCDGDDVKVIKPVILDSQHLLFTPAATLALFTTSLVSLVFHVYGSVQLLECGAKFIKMHFGHFHSSSG